MSTSPIALPVSDIIDVTVSVASGAIAPRVFNQGLIVGPSPRIPSYGANPRLREYASLAAMLADVFQNTDPEYLSATLYFSNNENTPVWVGRQDLTAIQTIIPHTGSIGNGYKLGDLITVVQSGGSNGVVEVAAVNGSGGVTQLVTIVGQQGTGYSIAAGLATTGGSGTGLEVDITAVGETYLQAVEACALRNQNWYGFMCCNAADSDHLALGAYSSANWETLLYFGSTSDVAIINGTANNIALQLQAVEDKAFLIYSTTQSGEYPNNAYTAAAVLGVYCAADTGAPSSAFTLKFKSVVGVAPEPLTQTQYNALFSANCNVYTSFGPYTILAEGFLSSGDFFDQILFRATLINLIQTNLMNLLVSSPKIPQTDAGEHQLLAQVDAACAALALIGYIGPNAVWTGNPVLNLATGDPLPLGYLNQAPPYSQQSAGARAARQAMPISCCLVEAGAVHSVQVNVFVEV
jgi:hypothetical protein